MSAAPPVLPLSFSDEQRLFVGRGHDVEPVVSDKDSSGGEPPDLAREPVGKLGAPANHDPEPYCSGMMGRWSLLQRTCG